MMVYFDLNVSCDIIKIVDKPNDSGYFFNQEAHTVEQFISMLMSLAENEYRYSCFAIDTKRKIGMKLKLSSQKIREFISDCLKYLCDTKFSKMQLGKYPTATPKDFVETIECNNEKISSTLSSFFSIPLNAETNATNLQNYNAYMLIVETEKGNHYFFTKKSPFVAYKKKNFFFAMFSEDEYDVVPSNMVRLIKHFDCLILNNICYITSLAGKNLLGLTNVAVENSFRNKERLLHEGIISSQHINLIHSYMKKPGKNHCLAEINESLIPIFSHITQDNNDSVKKKYRINTYQDPDGKLYIDVSDEKKLEDFIATLTNKRGKNFDDETVMTRSSFTKV